MSNKSKLSIIAIGDPHFTEKYLNVSEKFAEMTIETVREKRPDFVVVLGDLLDTKNVVRTQSHKLAVRFLKELGKICTTFLVVGNHDLMNDSQYLTDNHIFTPFHGVEEITNVHIVDHPKLYERDGFTFIFCPYVPPGRFIEALSTLECDQDSEEMIMWEMADCIFAHQEFKGCNFGARLSENGDEWLNEYPLVVSGHIHESQIVGTNIYYTGSAMQHSFSENAKKGIWHINFEDQDGSKEFSYEILPNHLKTKVTLTMTVKEAEEFNIQEQSEKEQELRICIVDEPSNLESFQKTKQNKKLEENGIKVVMRHNKDSTNLIQGKGTFWDNFHRLISERDDIIVSETIKKYL